MLRHYLNRGLTNRQLANGTGQAAGRRDTVKQRSVFRGVSSRGVAAPGDGFYFADGLVRGQAVSDWRSGGD